MKRIHRGLLLAALGFRGERIPPNFEGTFPNIECRSKWPEGVVCTADVHVLRSGRWQGPDGRWRKTSFHRVLVKCPRCERLIPFGRMHQHFDTGGCK